jgi:hypothetical protein
MDNNKKSLTADEIKAIQNENSLLKYNIQYAKTVKDVQDRITNHEGTSDYMIGYYNGMEVIMAFLEQRDPVFKLYSFEKEDQKIKTKRK